MAVNSEQHIKILCYRKRTSEKPVLILNLIRNIHCKIKFSLRITVKHRKNISAFTNIHYSNRQKFNYVFP